jgi:hypothetical protein
MVDFKRENIAAKLPAKMKCYNRKAYCNYQEDKVSQLRFQ